jgi:hypothetical protein
MAKRFTDSTKWSKPFIRSMKAPYKLLWLYILDECDHAGIWQVDFEVAQVKIGERINLETALQQLSGKIYPFADGEKWFIPDFIDFQYGVLNPDNRAHNSVIQLLNKYNLSLEIKPLTSPLQGAMDMDKVKDKEKVKVKRSDFLNYDEYIEILKLEDLNNEVKNSLAAHFKMRVANKWNLTHDAANLIIKEAHNISIKFGILAAIESINASTKSSWKDIYEPKNATPITTNNKPKKFLGEE